MLVLLCSDIFSFLQERARGDEPILQYEGGWQVSRILLRKVHLLGITSKKAVSIMMYFDCYVCTAYLEQILV
jgi:hypothetical protein